MAIPGPRAAPRAVAIAKAAEAAVRTENGVASATYLRLMILGAPSPVIALPTKHIERLPYE